jgi:hypothetical protein
MRSLHLGMGTGTDCAQLESEDEVLTAVEQLADQVEVPGGHAGLNDDVNQHGAPIGKRPERTSWWRDGW